MLIMVVFVRFFLSIGKFVSFTSFLVSAYTNEWLFDNFIDDALFSNLRRNNWSYSLSDEF